MEIIRFNLCHGESGPSGGIPVLKQKVRHGVQHDQIGAVRSHQNISGLLPNNPHAHETAQKIPMGQLILRTERCPQAPDRTLGRPVLCLQPVRQEEKQTALRALVPTQSGIPRLRKSRQTQQVSGLRQLGGREKVRGSGDIPAPRLLCPVQYLRQNQPVLPGGSQAVQQLSLIHGAAPGSGPGRHKPRLLPSAPRGFQAPQCAPPPPRRCGRHCGRWRGGGR